MAFIIYVVTGPEGKRYVGQTCQSVAARWRYHVRKAIHGAMGCPHFWSAIRKYGADAFDLQSLWRVETKDEANRAERTAIRMLRTRNPEFGYNLTDGGDGQAKGYQPTMETRAKISQAGLGRTMSPEGIARVRAVHLGRKRSPETRAKISAAGRGRKASPETKSKMSAARKGVKHSLAHIAKVAAAHRGLRRSPESVARMRLARWGRS